MFVHYHISKQRQAKEQKDVAYQEVIYYNHSKQNSHSCPITQAKLRHRAMKYSAKEVY